MSNNVISTEALIAKFEFALNNSWGYIWGTAGIMWTTAKQKQKVDYMISKYGNNWKKNADAKDDNYYGAAMYGEKWIGHTVADCSGLFRWAFRQLGSDIAHGSNSIWDRYCSAKGKLSAGKRTDGKELLPGTAVFTGTDSKKPHIGLYVGNGKVIEASGTQAGVCVSNINAGKWKYWGELKNVSYSPSEAPKTPSGGKDDETPMKDYPTLKKGSKGEYVAVLQQKLMMLGYSLPHYGIDGDFGTETENAVKQFQKDYGLNADGVVGRKTWMALESDNKTAVYYTVKIMHLTKQQVDSLMETYKAIDITEEK